MAKEIIEFYATDGAILDGYINKESNMLLNYFQANNKNLMKVENFKKIT